MNEAEAILAEEPEAQAQQIFDDIKSGEVGAVSEFPNCNIVLGVEGKRYPRTCAECGLGPCKLVSHRITEDSKDAEIARLRGELEAVKLYARGVEAIVDENDRLRAQLAEAQKIVELVTAERDKVRGELSDTESDVETLADHNIELHRQIAEMQKGEPVATVEVEQKEGHVRHTFDFDALVDFPSGKYSLFSRRAEAAGWRDRESPEDQQRTLRRQATPAVRERVHQRRFGRAQRRTRVEGPHTMTRLRRTTIRLLLLLAAVVGVVVAVVWAFLAILADSRSPRGEHVILSLDMTANAAFGGTLGETISSRAGRAERKGKPWACVLCRFLSWLQPHHCLDAINPEFAEQEK